MKTGPTGNYPDGKMTEDDRGEVCLQIGRADSYVMIEFGCEMSWMAMHPQQAREMGCRLIEWAARVDEFNEDEEKRKSMQ